MSEIFGFSCRLIVIEIWVVKELEAVSKATGEDAEKANRPRDTSDGKKQNENSCENHLKYSGTGEVIVWHLEIIGETFTTRKLMTSCCFKLQDREVVTSSQCQSHSIEIISLLHVISNKICVQRLMLPSFYP